MDALLHAARAMLDDALSGFLEDPCGAAIMAMYNALLSSLLPSERLGLVDHPNHAAALLAATRLQCSAEDEAQIGRLVRLYYHHDRAGRVLLSDAVRLTRLVLQRLAENQNESS